MSGKSNFLGTSLINHIFGGSSYAQPTQWWLALYSSDPGANLTYSSPSPITTLVQILSWTRAGNQVSNTNSIQLAAVPNGQTWNISYFALFDGNTNAANPLYTGAWTLTKTLSAGDIFTIAPGQIVLTEL
jgi:hypothetical protein